MEDIKVNELIVTCEACGSVKKFIVKNEEDSDRIFKDFVCENDCGKNLYSFIMVGKLNRAQSAT